MHLFAAWWLARASLEAQAAPGPSDLGLCGYRAVLFSAQKYRDSSFPDLQTPNNDVQQLGKVLAERYGFAVDPHPDATREQILGKLQQLESEVRECEALVVYYGGHGYRDPRAQEGYWIPTDASWLRASWVSNADVQASVRAIKARHVLVIVNSCFSGTLVRDVRPRESAFPEDQTSAMALLAHRSRYVWTSGASTELVRDVYRDTGMSPFAYFLRQLLEQQNAPYPTPLGLAPVVQQRVTGNTPSQRPQFGQFEDTGDEGGQLVLFSVEGRLLADAEREWSAAIRQWDSGSRAELGAWFAKWGPGGSMEEQLGRVLAVEHRDEARRLLHSTPPPVTPVPKPVDTPSPRVEAPVPPLRPARRPGEPWTSPSGVVLRWVPGGTFEMGSPRKEAGRNKDERQHEVTVDGLWVMQTEVTQGLWSSVMGSNPSGFGGCGADCPVEWVSWFDAVAFANALSEAEGLTPAYVVSGEEVEWNRVADGYRLLTEAEWEYAARGGEGFVYAGSNDVMEVGWVGEDWASGSTHHVCTKKVNRYGLCDMSGNVWEWVWDWYGKYPSRSESNPSGTGSDSDRVFRGGSRSFGPAGARVANRDGNPPGYRGRSLGLRLARPAP